MAERVVVLAPNWLGDAVMALPALAALRRHWPEARVTVAARPSVVPLFDMVPGVDHVLTLDTTAGLGAVTRWRRDAARLEAGRFDVALVLPNSFLSAWIAAHARIPERWGYAADLRARFLTRAVTRPRAVLHQADYYRALATKLGLPEQERFARVTLPHGVREDAARLLAASGLPSSEPFVVMAPGAAYGRAKQWPPVRFAELAASLFAAAGLRTVLVGTRSDSGACAEVLRAATRSDAALPAPLDLAGRTSLPVLAGVLSLARALVTNDSGAMHLGGAVGTHVVAVFGPTSEHHTSPLTTGPEQPPPAIVTHAVWCRPCMLRECPIDHRCMRRVTAATVLQALRDSLQVADCRLHTADGLEAGSAE